MLLGELSETADLEQPSSAELADDTVEVGVQRGTGHDASSEEPQLDATEESKLSEKLQSISVASDSSSTIAAGLSTPHKSKSDK